jgi:hypothetical protein
MIGRHFLLSLFTTLCIDMIGQNQRSAQNRTKQTMVSLKNCSICEQFLDRTTFFKCSTCPNFMCCINCEGEQIHDRWHALTQFDSSVQVKRIHHQLWDRSHMVHEGYFCEFCRGSECIIGFRFNCMKCQIDLCESCEAKGLHDFTHPRLKVAATPTTEQGKERESNHDIQLNRVVSPFEVPASLIKAMLAREDELRLSNETQLAYKNYRLAGKGEEGMETVVEDLQRRVVKEFGLPIEVGLEAIRCAETLLPGDPEVKVLSLYRRHNRCVDGDLKVGDVAPDVELYTLSLDKIRLLEMVSVGRPLIIIAGSYT